MNKKMDALIRMLWSKYKSTDKKLQSIPVYKKISDNIKKEYVAPTVKHAPLVQLYENSYATEKPNFKKYLFDSYWGRRIGCNPYAIYRAIANESGSEDFEFYWLREPGVSVPDDVRKDVRVTFVSPTSQLFVDCLLTCGFIFTNMSLPVYFTPKPGQVIINTWHGIPIKKLGLDTQETLTNLTNVQRNFNIADINVSSSKYATDKIYNSYRATLAAQKAIEVGSPRIDLTLNANISLIQEKLNINPKKKVILYAPTWRGKQNNANIDIEQQINLIEKLNIFFDEDYHILLSMHHATLASLKGKTTLNIIPSDIDINEVLSVTDILISDYSSIIIDYLVLDRPIVLYMPDRDQYESERGLYIKPEDLPVNVAYDINTTLNKIRSPKRPSEFKSYKNTINQLLPHEDGKASSRVLSALRDLREVRSHQQKNILISAGGLHNNGITSALLSLLDCIDHTKYSVHILVNAQQIDKNPAIMSNFTKLNKHTSPILRTAFIGTSEEEKNTYKSYLANLKLDNYELIMDIMAREGRRLWGNQSFEVAIDFGGYSPMWQAIIASSNAKRTICYQHSDMFQEVNNPNKSHEQLPNVFQQYKYIDGICSVSKEVFQANHDNLSKWYGRSESFYCLNPINVTEIRKKSEFPLALLSPSLKAIKEESSAKIFINVARLSPEKNQTLLMNAFKLVVDSGENAFLFLVGSGPHEKELKEHALRINISERVIFTGFIANPYPLMKNSDCFVLSSDYEGQGISLLEAVTLGVPAVTTQVPAARSGQDYGNINVVKSNAEEMASAMLKVINGDTKKQTQTTYKDINIYTNEVMESFYKKVLKLDV